jgi:hypothetical protein
MKKNDIVAIKNGRDFVEAYFIDKRGLRRDRRIRNGQLGVVVKGRTSFTTTHGLTPDGDLIEWSEPRRFSRMTLVRTKGYPNGGEIYVATRHLVKVDITTQGEVELPNGTTLCAGQGGSYRIGSDVYPITIVGWSERGRKLFFREARRRAVATSDYYGEQRYMFWDDPQACIRVATWRRGGTRRNRAGVYMERGSSCGAIYTDGYACHMDPSF